jgi:3-oxoacyl-(acyl-carrier-protein) synthase
MAAGTALLEQGEHALALGREPLAAVVQRAAQGIAGHRGGQG